MYQVGQTVEVSTDLWNDDTNWAKGAKIKLTERLIGGDYGGGPSWRCTSVDGTLGIIYEKHFRAVSAPAASPYQPGQLVQLTTNNAWRHGYAKGATVRLDRLTPEGWKIIGGGVVPESDMRPAGPVRRREVLEVVAGQYGIVSVKENFPQYADSKTVNIAIQPTHASADELAAAARVLTQLAEALRERS